MCDHQSLRSACAYVSLRTFANTLEYSMNVKLLTEHHLEFLILNRGCTGSSESTLVKIQYCCKSNSVAYFMCFTVYYADLCINSVKSTSEGININYTDITKCKIGWYVTKRMDHWCSVVKGKSQLSGRDFPVPTEHQWWSLFMPGLGIR